MLSWRTYIEINPSLTGIQRVLGQLDTFLICRAMHTAWRPLRIGMQIALRQVPATESDSTDVNMSLWSSQWS